MTFDGDRQRQLVNEMDWRAGDDCTAAEVLQAEHCRERKFTMVKQQTSRDIPTEKPLLAAAPHHAQLLFLTGGRN